MEPKEKQPIMVKSPYTGQEVNVEPLLRLLSHNETDHYTENLCHDFRNLQLEMMRHYGKDFYEELRDLNEIVSMLVETKHNLTLNE